MSEFGAQKNAFTTLLMGVFIHNPYFPIDQFGNITETDVYRRYGPSLSRGLTTFSQLSSAEQNYLVHYLQR